MELARNFSQIFWSPDVWLPPNVTWDNIAPTPENRFADYRHLVYPIPMALVVLVLRYALERFCFSPFGRYIGIKSNSSKKAPPNAILDKAYNGKKIKQKQITALAKQLDWTERQVERWLRLRRAQDKPSKLTKFCESSWRCLYYTSAFLTGLYILWDKPWLWDINHCYYGYPYHSVSNDVWWYYMLSMSFYWSLSFSQFFDVKRKDFWQMFVHHIATIVLMCFSWVGNLTRIGSLVLLVHDSADIFLEGAKVAKYANYQRLCDGLFVILTVVWIITRMGVYPFWIIYSTSVEAPKILPMFPAYYIFNSLLSLLLVLHAFWTYLILKIAYNAFNAGRMEGDIRSDSSEEISEELNGAATNNVGNHISNSNIRQKQN
ncbi:ceramide synthase 6 [Copidosoma floridanum]|uniref:ceramide synthase 6 n=1 Tax=Copidosoma floridanum TaxID=29053 RepID=UPI0006C97BC6|nr:ceramide synthase 6 [Copidosoma floridanum]